MKSEREVKLEVSEGFVLPDLEGIAGGLGTASDEPTRFETSYLDTEDLRLARWGCSLRHREGQGWTLKLPPARDGVLAVPGELLVPGGAEHVPEDLLDLVAAYTRGREVRPSLRLSTVRRRVALLSSDGRPVGEVVDDEIQVLEGERVADRFREVKVEIGEGLPARALRDVVGRLRSAGARRSKTTKYLRALGARAPDGPEVVVPGAGSEATATEVIRAAVATSVVRLVMHDAGVRLGDDPEDVHQARVATRRLRSDLRTFGDFLDEAWSNSLRDELGWLGGELGAVRDADVLIGRLDARVADLPPEDTRTSGQLLGRLRRSRRDARARLLGSLRSPRYLDLLERLVAVAQAPLILDRAAGPALGLFGSVVERPWDGLLTAIGGLGDDPSDEALHVGRIWAKRVRYAAEALVPVFGKPARDFARAATGLQNVLGEHQDAVVAGKWLRAAAARSNPEQAFIAGELAVLEHRAAELSKASWPAAWRQLSRKRLRFWV